MSLKQKLKILWDFISKNPQTKSDRSNEKPVVKIIIPELSEEEKISKQIVDTVIEDLRKFPPSEWRVSWNATPHIYSLYEHKCLTYSLHKISSNEVYVLQHGYTVFSEKDMIRLYNAFYIPYQESAKIRELERNKKSLSEFLDDTKRIKCE